MSTSESSEIATPRSDPAVSSSEYPSLKESQILEAEYLDRFGPLPNPASSSPKDRLQAIRIAFHKQRPTALCLSGGGIRSATYSLGIIEGLAKASILHKFTYLSTVSGGGYIGGWLTAWMHRELEGGPEVCNQLASHKHHPDDSSENADGQRNSEQHEAKPLQHLREYSNFLTPRAGLFSLDTWAALTIWLRNMVINWTILVPLLIAIMCLPIAYQSAISASLLAKHIYWPHALLEFILLASGMSALAYLMWSRPSLQQMDRTLPSFLKVTILISLMAVSLLVAVLSYFSARSYLHSVLVPITSAFLFLLVFSYFTRRSERDDPDNLDIARSADAHSGTLSSRSTQNTDFWHLCLIPVILIAFLLPAYLNFRHESSQLPLLIKASVTGYLGIAFSLVWYISGGAWLNRRLWEFIIFVITGFVWFLLEVRCRDIWNWFVAAMNFPKQWPQYFCAEPALSLLFTLSCLSLFVALTGRLTDEEDREWWGRFGAYLLLIAGGWITLCSLAIVGPYLLRLSASVNRPWVKGVYALLSGSGVASLLAGRSGKTPTDGASDNPQVVSIPLTVLASIFGAIFLATLLSAIALGIQFIVGIHPSGIDELWGWLKIGAVLFLGLVLSPLLVGINRFSLHALYRNRLIRGYLGASHLKRKANPFTRFDPDDNVWMHELRFVSDTAIGDIDNVVSKISQHRQIHDLLSEEVLALVHSRLAAKAEKNEKEETQGPRRLSRRAISSLSRLSDPVNRGDRAGWTRQEQARFKRLLARDLDSRVRNDPTSIVQALSKACTTSADPDSRKSAMDLLRSELKLCLSAGRLERPFHIVNLTLNLVGGKDLNWQERKGESFTVSSLHAGSGRVGYRDSERYGGEPTLFGWTRDFTLDRGISLGTAIAVSGAAASPNMGYISSPVVTLLMTLFNLRLGWWLGNPGPAGYETFQRSEPRYALQPWISEALGQTDDQSPYIYLSDGGHFENLGLYEMVRRRCHFIVVCDATADPEYSFSDLGNAIQKIRVDLGISIKFEEFPIWKYDENKPESKVSKVCALAQIFYSEVDSTDGGPPIENGWLLYIKPTLCGDETLDVLNYARKHMAFPHQSTINQWFYETEFESYRALGAFAIRRIVTGQNRKWRLGSVEELKARAKEYLEGTSRTGERASANGTKDRSAEAGANADI
jgi:hypothetical protein